jgi:two-component system, NtrC family, sensor histidine kinase KinB
LCCGNKTVFGIRAKLYVALGGLCALLIAVSLYATLVFNRYSSLVNQMTHDNLDRITAARDMHDAVNSVSDATQDALGSGQALAPTSVDAAKQDFDHAAAALQSSGAMLPGEQEIAQAIRTKWAEVLSAAQSVLNASAADRRPLMHDHLIPAIRQIRPMLTQLSQLNEYGIKSTYEQISTDAQAARWRLYGAILIGLLAATGLAFVVGRRFATSLRGLTAAAEAVAAGNLNQRLPVSGHDELGRFLETFNRMSVELQRLRALDADKLLRAFQTTQAAIDSLPDGVIMVDEHGQVEVANEAAARLLGVRAGQRDPGLIAPWLREAIERPGETLNNYRSSVPLDDGARLRHFLPRSVALRDSAGRVVGTTIVLADVTEYRRLDEFKNSLLALASHELRTPLTSMRMIVPVLLEQSHGRLNPRQTELAGVLRDATERMHGVVEKVLNLGRMASGKIPLDSMTVPPADLIRKALAAQREAYQAKGVDLRASLLVGLPLVRCDPVLIDLVFSNLLKNALAYSSSGGKVTLSAAARASMVVFQVQDTGCGIAAVHLPRVFESFFRVPGQSSDSGTGLGLALVKQIVESHGGTVGAESSVGQGSTFWFILPVVQENRMSPDGGKITDSGKSSPPGDTMADPRR